MATLYVNGSTGDDARSYATAQNSATPWLTIYRAAKGAPPGSADNAAQAAAAGDTVLVTAGTYSVAGTSSRLNPAYNPVNAGTAGNYITFRGVGTVDLRLSSGTGPVIGTNGRNYIKWDTFYIDEANAHAEPDTGPVVVNGADFAVITNLTIIGREPTWYGTGDNHNGIRLEGTDGTVVSNNRISGVISFGGGYENRAAGIMTYATTNSIIEHNEISGCGTGIYPKNAIGIRGLNITVRFNYLHGNRAGIRLQESTDSNVYQNIVSDGITADGVGFEYDAELLTDNHVVNNTFYNVKYGWFSVNGSSVTVTGQVLKNNIFVLGTTGIYHEGTQPFDTGWVMDRNNYYALTNIGRADNANRTTLAAWIANTPADDNSIATDPLFVNATPTTAAHFKLQGGSPALTLGRVVNNIGGTTGDTIPAGAYITGSETIGILLSGGDSASTVGSACVVARFIRFISIGMASLWP